MLPILLRKWPLNSRCFSKCPTGKFNRPRTNNRSQDEIILSLNYSKVPNWIHNNNINIPSRVNNSSSNNWHTLSFKATNSYCKNSNPWFRGSKCYSSSIQGHIRIWTHFNHNTFGRTPISNRRKTWILAIFSLHRNLNFTGRWCVLHSTMTVEEKLDLISWNPILATFPKLNASCS